MKFWTNEHNQTQPDKKNWAYQGFRGLFRYERTQSDSTRQAPLSSHNPEVAGSNPVSATIKITWLEIVSSQVILFISEYALEFRPEMSGIPVFVYLQHIDHIVDSRYVNSKTDFISLPSSFCTLRAYCSSVLQPRRRRKHKSRSRQYQTDLCALLMNVRGKASFKIRAMPRSLCRWASAWLILSCWNGVLPKVPIPWKIGHIKRWSAFIMSGIRSGVSMKISELHPLCLFE